MTYLYGGSTEGRIKLTTDTDCLAPDIRGFAGMVTTDPQALAEAIRTLAEQAGLEVCIDLGDYFYETEQLSMEGSALNTKEEEIRNA